MTVTDKKELERRRKRRDLGEPSNLQMSLDYAFKRIECTPANKITAVDREASIRQIRLAITVTKEHRNHKNVATRMLFPYSKQDMLRIDNFVRQDGFATLIDIVKLPFSQIEEALQNFGLECPISLRTMYEVYHELEAERTQPAKLTA